jgi:hypothetical protein
MGVCHLPVVYQIKGRNEGSLVRVHRGHFECCCFQCSGCVTFHWLYELS